MPQALCNPTKAQRQRLRQFDTTQCVDVHCHCLPGLDDGPDTLEEALALCRALVEDGITRVIATPHQLGRYDGQYQTSQIRSAVSSLNTALAEEGLPLSVVPGADIRVDERIPELLKKDTVLTLADLRRHLLLELPEGIFIELKPLIVQLALQGITTIISHPERNWFLARHPQTILSWLEEGASLQVTAGSLLGSFGPMAETMSWYWLSKGLASLVATDAHNTGQRRPCMSAAIELISERLGHLEAKRLCIDNPLRVLNGRELLGRRGRLSVGARA